MACRRTTFTCVVCCASSGISERPGSHELRWSHCQDGPERIIATRILDHGTATEACICVTAKDRSTHHDQNEAAGAADAWGVFAFGTRGGVATELASVTEKG